MVANYNSQMVVASEKLTLAESTSANVYLLTVPANFELHDANANFGALGAGTALTVGTLSNLSSVITSASTVAAGNARLNATMTSSAGAGVVFTTPTDIYAKVTGTSVAGALFVTVEGVVKY